MGPVEAVLTGLGLSVIAVTLYDVVATILVIDHAGPITRVYMRWTWRMLLLLHRARPAHGLLSGIGPVMVVITIVVWYALLAFGTWLILVGHPGAVISSTTRIPADHSQTVYYVTTTLSSLGYGDLIPDGSPWTWFSTTMTLVATMVLTLSLSYVLSVVSAAIGQRSVASGINALGTDPVEWVRVAGNDPGEASTGAYLAGLASQLGHVSAQRRAYPVLRHFHAARRQTASAPAVLLLADALFLMTRLPRGQRPSAGLQAALEAAIDDYTGPHDPRTSSAPSSSEQVRVVTAQAGELGLDIDDPSWPGALQDHLPRRAMLVAICRDDGWSTDPDED